MPEKRQMRAYNTASKRTTEKKPEEYGYLRTYTGTVCKEKRKEAMENTQRRQCRFDHHTQPPERRSIRQPEYRNYLKEHLSYAQELFCLTVISFTCFQNRCGCMIHDRRKFNEGEHTHQPWSSPQIPPIHRITISSRSVQHRRLQRRGDSHLFASLAYSPLT